MTQPYYQDDLVTVHHGDCLDVMRRMPDASVHAVVTDPPYLLAFMGRAWDTRSAHEHLEWHGAWAAEAFRLLKPGGHLLAFGGTRTWHRLAVAIEDAGFEIRDSIAWLYGSGFPKSLDVSRAIDAHQKHGGSSSVQKRRASMGDDYTPSDVLGKFRNGAIDTMNTPHTPAPEQVGERTSAAQQWAGWGTALKPAFEPIVVARKPLARTVAQNVLAHGTGALNVDSCRVHALDAEAGRTRHGGGIPGNGSSYELPDARPESPAGRWPTNVVLEADTAAAELDRQSGESVSASGKQKYRRAETTGWRERGGSFTPGREWDAEGYGDSGGASRFFPTFRYEAKAPTEERPRAGGVAHPTVKPLDLMRWLVRLVTPPGGTVLDPFAGSGTTAEACVIEGFPCITIEREADYLPLILARLTKPIEPVLDLGALA